MPGVVLGKRVRDVTEGADLVPRTPSKRALRNAKPAFYNDENQDPEVFADEEDDVLAELPRKKQKTFISHKPVTPSTPRHRDAFSSPSTPRHVVMSAGKLFKRATPSTPLTPSTPSSIQTIYHSARQLFTRGTEPGQLIGREAEREQLTAFLERCSPEAASSSGGCLYVSGPPGTGKSAMVGEMTRNLGDVEGVQSAYINCMSIKSTLDLYRTLLEALGEDGNASEADAVSTLQSLFCPRKSEVSKVYLVTLDEIDHILTMGLESLYRVFEWSLAKSSRLVLVGIANALDLTDRFLPRLKSKNLKPDLLPFLPYNAGQIKKIITSRLVSLMPEGSTGHVPFIHPAAIDLCSRKVASQTGDLRKAFGICRRALDLIEQETRSKHEDEAREQLLQATPSKRPLGEKVNNASSGNKGPKTVVQLMSQSLKALSPQTAPRASIGHLNKVTAEVFSNGTSQRLKALNLQQKAALCSLVAYENRARASMKAGDGVPVSKAQTLAPSIKILFNTYCRLCTRDSVLHPLSSSEFREVVGSLETLGLVNAVDGKIGSFATPQTPSKRGRKATVASGDDKRIASATGDKDMESMTDGIGAGILKSILSGEALD